MDIAVKVLHIRTIRGKQYIRPNKRMGLNSHIPYLCTLGRATHNNNIRGHPKLQLKRQYIPSNAAQPEQQVLIQILISFKCLFID